MSEGKTPVMDALVDFVLGLEPAALPPAVGEAAGLCLTDWLGTAIRGSAEPLAGALVSVIVTSGGDRGARPLRRGGGRRGAPRSHREPARARARDRRHPGGRARAGVRNHVEAAPRGQGGDERAPGGAPRPGGLHRSGGCPRTLEKHIKAARGTADNPLSRAEVEAKFRRLAGMVLPAERVERLAEILGRLATLPDLAPLVALAGP
jgi:2-methylcitrate dehydratase PrpD